MLKSLYLSTALVASFAQAALAQQSGSSAGSAGNGSVSGTGTNVAAAETVVVTGSRGQPRTVTSSSTPIDVIGAQALTQLSGGGPLRDELSSLLPSFQAQDWVGSSSWNTIIRPAGLRGLGGADVLVLVNGKRRHNGALLDLSTGNLDNGANPVDLDQIPDEAIDHIEVLRDGASAQYGSDAVAGVINIILKKDADHGSLDLRAGQRYAGDGASYGAATMVGFSLPRDGSITLTGTYNGSQRATRATAVPGSFYFPINGQPDPREATVNRFTYLGGLPDTNAVMFSENGDMRFGDISVYNTGTLGYRVGFVGQAGRKPNATTDIDAIYPDGYTPFYTLREIDFQDTTGAEGTLDGWNWDLSTTYGQDFVMNGSKHTLNASLGPASPTRFSTFSTTYGQLTTNLDLTQAIKLAGRPLQISFGAEHRYEYYSTAAKDPAAYTAGGYVYPAGTPLAGKPAAIGTQGAIIVLPTDQADLSRSVLAGYGDLEYNLTDAWLVGLAGRVENYSDSAGTTASGKFSTRYEFSPEFAVRATVSNGFRAPSLPQEGFAKSSDQLNVVNGAFQLIQAKLVTVNSPIGEALGSKPLKPETSMNYSAGFVYTPTGDINVTVDAYEIDLLHRVALTGLLTGAGVNAILVANGQAANQQIQYFANAINTRTQGLDAVATYQYDMDDFGLLRLSVGLNENYTQITRIEQNPSQLANLGLTLFDRQAQGAITVANPHTKIILGENWLLGGWDVNLRETRYGSITALNDTPSLDQHYGPKWLTDVSVTRQFNDTISLTVGADNVFNVYPDNNTVPNTSGLPNFAGISPFGYYGGYYYMRIKYNLW